MANVILVDQNDKEIGLKERSLLSGNDWYRISCLWVTNTQGDVLTAKRSLTKAISPGRWGCAVSGTIEEGETYDSNIVKECAEEIGLRVSLEQLQRGPKIRDSVAERTFFAQWYLLVSDAPTSSYVLDPTEVAELRFASVNQLRRELAELPDTFTKNFKNAFEELVTASTNK